MTVIDPALVTGLLILAASIVAGISWNTIGIWQKYKELGSASIDWLKVRKNVVIGTVLGFIGYTLTITEAVTIPAITSLDTFLLAVIAFFPFIVIAERVFARKAEDQGTPKIV